MIYILSNPLSMLINISVESGIYPDKLKHAKVIPIFKSDDETDPSNYRPISLLSIFNRIYEKVMYKSKISKMSKISLRNTIIYMKINMVFGKNDQLNMP